MPSFVLLYQTQEDCECVCVTGGTEGAGVCIHTHVCVLKQLQTKVKLSGRAASGHICSKDFFVGAPKAYNHGVNHNYIV